jgi:hypothetical protein
METFPDSVVFRGKEIPLFDEKQLRNVSRANLKQREPSPNRLAHHSSEPTPLCRPSYPSPCPGGCARAERRLRCACQAQ